MRFRFKCVLPGMSVLVGVIAGASIAEAQTSVSAARIYPGNSTADSVIPGYQQGVQYGYSVAIDSTGRTAVVGAPYDNGRQGAVWVWVRSSSAASSSWLQQTKLVTPADEAHPNNMEHLGGSVAVSADGMTVVAGGWTKSCHSETATRAMYCGFARVYKRNPTTAGWNHEALLIDSASVSAVLYTKVSVSSDGNTVVVADPRTGIAKIWTRSGSTWSFQESVPSSGEHALSPDGNVLLTRAGSDTAWFWQRTGTVWSRLAGIADARMSVNSHVPEAFALSANADVAVLGSLFETPSLWVRSGNNWSVQQVLAGPYTSGSVSVSSNGNVVAVGDPKRRNDTGAVWIWSRTNGESAFSQSAWGTVSASTLGRANLGSAVDVSLDGGFLVVGGVNDGTGNYPNGAAWAVQSPAQTGGTSSGASGSTTGGTASQFVEMNPPVSGTPVLLRAVPDTTLPSHPPYAGSLSAKEGWSGKFREMQCPLGQSVIGLAVVDPLQQMPSWATQSIRCGAGYMPVSSQPVVTCRNVAFPGTSSQNGNPAAGDWDGGYYKGTCTPGEYVAGVSQDDGGSFQSMLCCSSTAQPHPSRNLNAVNVVGNLTNYASGKEPGASSTAWANSWATPGIAPSSGYYQCGQGRYVVGISHDIFNPDYKSQPIVSGMVHGILCAGESLP